VIVNALTPFTPITAGAKLFATVGGPFTVNNPPDDGVVLLPAFVVTPPVGIVFVRLPAIVAVTFTVTVQELLTAIVPPDNDTVPPPPVAETVPLHVVAAFGDAAFTRPEG